MGKVTKMIKSMLAGAMAFSLVSVINATGANAEGETGGDVVNNPDPVVQDGLVLEKNVSVNEDGTYDITLESYAEGEFSYVTKVIPADVVLVLDVSGSMEETFVNEYRFEKLDSKSYTLWNYGSNQYYYKHTDGNYYRVYSGSFLLGLGSFLYYEVDGVRWYLNGSGSSTSVHTVWTAFSTIYTGVLYRRVQVSSITKMEALQNAVCAFIDEVKKKNDSATTADEMSRISIVKFAGNRVGNNNADPYPYSQYANYLGDSHYQGGAYNNTQVVIDLTDVTAAEAESMKQTVNSLEEGGATAADWGMNFANAVFDAHPVAAGSDRQQVVIMFTDGEPNHSSGFDTVVAKNTVSAALSMKQSGIISYTIAVYPAANPSIDPENEEYPSTASKNINTYLHAVSSNYPEATNYTDSERGTRNPDGNRYYYVAQDANELTNIFKSISSTVGGSSTTLSNEAVMKDIISSSFALPANFSSSGKLTIQALKWDTTNHVWSNENDDSLFQEGPNKIYPDIYKDEKGQDVIDIKNFNYSYHCRTPIDTMTDPDTEDPMINANARKLRIVIHGVQARTDSITGDTMQTNAEGSGIYPTAEATKPVVNFPSPTVSFQSKTYVMDYVKGFELNYKDVLASVDRVDNPEDEYLLGEKIADFDWDKTYTAKNGTVKFVELEHDAHTENFRLWYEPKTMVWDGYDNIFVKGMSKDPNPLNVWTKLSIIPADNIYYEDSFISTTPADGTAATVGITYTGSTNDDTAWSVVGTPGGNTETPNDPVFGWVDSMADDTEYSDGTAHMAAFDKNNKAKATFSFTGTGVDVYSRTNNSTGTVFVRIVSDAKNDAKKPVYSKSMSLSTKAANGDYYQVPTYYSGTLPYGKYEVTIQVTNADKNRLEYYLDGIRVYNPVLPKDGDETIKAAYNNELHAVFTLAKELIDAGHAMCYVDEVKPGENGENGAGGQVNYADTAAAKLAPLNEIYLAPGYEVQINSEYLNNTYVGMKAPEGATEATFTVGSVGEGGSLTELASKVTIGHSGDLYYKVAPNSAGQIVIKNTGNNLLSITKLRNVSETRGETRFAPVDEEKALRTLSEFRNYTFVDYEDEVLAAIDNSEDAEEITEAEEPADQPIEVLIENPEPEPEPEPEQKSDDARKENSSWWSRLFGGFRGFYRP